MQGGGKKSSKRDKAIHNHVWNVINSNMHRTSKMFKLNPDTGAILEQAKDIEVYMDKVDQILDPKQLSLMEFEGFPLVKSVRSDCPHNKRVEIIDLKLDTYGPNEDLFYSTFPSLVKNIRRGNTLLKVHDDDKAKYYIGRKGLMKFFDLRLGFVSKLERDELNTKTYKEDIH